MKKLGNLVTAVTLATAFVCAGLTNTAKAEVVIEHIGANDPVTESWGANFPFGQSGPEVFAGPVINDPGFGLDAWFIDDDGSAGGNRGTYFRILTATQFSQGETFGWTLSARLRIVEFPDPAPGAIPTAPGITIGASPVISFRNRTTSYQIHIGAQADGDPIVFLLTGVPPSASGTEIILEGEGSGYHLYELIFDPGEGDVDLFIDGVERFNGYSGAPLAGDGRVIFGAGDSVDLGEGNFNLVRFEVGPGEILVEPVVVDFGQIDAFTTTDAIVTVSNTDFAVLTVDDILVTLGDPNFFVADIDAGTPPFVLSSGDSVFVTVTFIPTSEGVHEGTLTVLSDDSDEPTVDVSLIGNGLVGAVEEQATLLEAAVGDAIIDGTLDGSGEGLSSSSLLDAFVQITDTAGDLIEAGLIDGACAQLNTALRRVDGVSPPPDFVGGDDAALIALQIEFLRDSLGCM